MAGDDPFSIAISQGNDLRTLFPGYYQPNESQRADAYRQGLVSLDANALLDLYRFTPKAREEFLQILEKIQERLFVPHQVALEFQRNRMQVAYERFARAGTDEREQIGKQLSAVRDRLREFAKRYQIEETERDRLCALIDNVNDELGTSITSAVAYDLNRDDIRTGTDPVLQRIEQLLQGRIGSPRDDDESPGVLKEAERRLREKVPPGYKDANKGEQSEAFGDYLLWSQLLHEVGQHDRPVLFISNEQKEDWVLLGPSREILGPRPELVLEMKKKAGSDLHTVTVAGLLKEAPGFLGASVSDSTIREAEALPDWPRRIIVNLDMSSAALETRSNLSGNDALQLTGAFEQLGREMVVGEVGWWLSPKIKRLSTDMYSLRWSAQGRATFTFSEEGALGTVYVNFYIHDIATKDTRDIEPA